jgi:hypothetical protein
VNIPQIETGILSEVLRLPYGFEICHLLTRWNPINARRRTRCATTGRTCFVVGMGPAGYTLAQHLLTGLWGGGHQRPQLNLLRYSSAAPSAACRNHRDIDEIAGPLSGVTLGFGGCRVRHYHSMGQEFLDIST